MGLPHEKHLAQVITRSNKKHLAQNESLLDCAIELIPDNICHLTKTTSPERAVLLLTLVKGAKTFRALNILASTGLGPDAMILLRTLTELLVTLRFIAKEDSALRARKFFVFATVVNSHKALLALGADPDNPQDDQSRQLSKQVAEAKTEFGEKWWNAALKASNWSGLRIGGMAREANLGKLYETTYARACEATHGSDISDHVRVSDNGDFSLDIMPNADWVEPVLLEANRIFAELLLDLNRALSLPRSASLATKILRSRVASSSLSMLSKY